MPAIPGSQVQGQPHKQEIWGTKTLSQENQKWKRNKDRETWILFQNCHFKEEHDSFIAFCFLKGEKKEKRSKIWTIPMRNFLKSCFSYGKSGAALELLDYEHHRHYSLACNGCVWFLHPEPRPSNTEIPVLTYTPPATSRVSLCPGEGSGFGGARLRGAIDQNRESAVFLLGHYSKQLSQMAFRR